MIEKSKELKEGNKKRDERLERESTIIKDGIKR